MKPSRITLLQSGTVAFLLGSLLAEVPEYAPPAFVRISSGPKIV